MANLKTLADSICDAYDTGKEATILYNGTLVTFSPQGIVDMVLGEGALIDDVTASAAELNILDGATLDVDELNTLDGITATVAELNILDGVTSSAAELNILDGVTATAAEINKAADVSSFVLTATNTAGAAAAATHKVIELDHATVIIEATWTVVPNTLLIVKDTSASGTAAHTLTLTGGTFDGTNTIATLNARDEALVVWFDSAGRGTIIVNVGAVALS